MTVRMCDVVHDIHHIRRQMTHVPIVIVILMRTNSSGGDGTSNSIYDNDVDGLRIDSHPETIHGGKIFGMVF